MFETDHDINIFIHENKTENRKSKPKIVMDQLSKHCERTEHVQPVEANKKVVGMDDIHTEFFAKFNSPNRGLKSNSARPLRDLPPTNTPPTIFDEFKAKMMAKLAKHK